MTTPSTDAAPSKGLIARVFGIFLSPRATYADVAAHPRVLGALAVVVVCMAGPTSAFLSTEIGRRAMVDQQLSTLESFGVKVTDTMIESMEQRADRGAIFSLAGTAVGVPIVFAILSGLALVVFNAALGGEATFRQVFAIVVHSGFIAALQTVFVMPLNYARESMSSATSLLVFLPMVDDTRFLGLLLGSIDFFRIWSAVSLAIGLAVLYKRRTAPVAWSLLAVYAVSVAAIAGVRAALSGV
jgi:hypothetical protein